MPLVPYFTLYPVYSTCMTVSQDDGMVKVGVWDRNDVTG